MQKNNGDSEAPCLWNKCVTIQWETEYLPEENMSSDSKAVFFLEQRTCNVPVELSSKQPKLCVAHQNTLCVSLRGDKYDCLFCPHLAFLS